MPSTVDLPLLELQKLLASPAVLAGPALYLAVASLAAFAVFQFVLARPPLPKNAPKAWSACDWPIVGSALAFYSRRRDMVMAGLAASPTGNFSFYIGNKHVVVLSGPGGRKTFYENRTLNFSAG
jgi:sterol 14-demethylase